MKIKLNGIKVMYNVDPVMDYIYIVQGLYSHDKNGNLIKINW